MCSHKAQTQENQMSLGRRASRKGLKWDLQQISGLSDQSWVNFRKTNAQGGITAFQTWHLVSSCFPNFNIPVFPPAPCGAGSSIPSLLPLPHIAPLSPNIPYGTRESWEDGASTQGIPKGFPRDSQGIPAPELPGIPGGTW